MFEQSCSVFFSEAAGEIEGQVLISLCVIYE